MSNLVQAMKLCAALEPSRGAGPYNCEGIDLRNAHMVFAVVQLDQAGADTTTVRIQVDDGTDGNWEAIAETLPHWVNNDTDADDVLVRPNNAINYETTVDVNPKMVVFQVDPAKLGENTTSNDPNVAMRLRIEAGAAGDTVSAFYIVVPTRYKGATVPEVRL